MGTAVKRDYSINKRLRKFLTEHDKKTSLVADKAGLRRDTFSQILSSKRVVFAEEVPKIAEAAGCTVDYLLGCGKTQDETAAETGNTPELHG